MSTQKYYKERRPFFQRKMEVNYMRSKYPSKVPVVIERHKKEKVLPSLDKIKFLIPQEMTYSQFISVVRSRLNLYSTQSIFIMIAHKHIPSLTATMSEIYTSYKDEDGFLYVEYTSEEIFG